MVKHIPNFLTFLRLIAIAVFPIFLNNMSTMQITIYILLAYYISDQLDGLIARKANATSHFGHVFDITVDRFCDLYLSCFALLTVPESAIFIIPFLALRFMFEHLLQYNSTDSFQGAKFRRFYIESNLLIKTLLWVCIFTSSPFYIVGILNLCLTICFLYSMLSKLFYLYKNETTISF